LIVNGETPAKGKREVSVEAGAVSDKEGDQVMEEAGDKLS
jgi:hypothetical protein